jgi:hypothetical protein
VNESAATFKWLLAQIGLEGSDTVGPVRSAWNDARTTMLSWSSGGQQILQEVDWISDFWIARGAVPVADLGQFAPLAPVWMPPEDITHWPAFDVEDVVALFPGQARQSNHTAFSEMILAARAPINADETALDALERYLELKSKLVPRVFDIPAIQTEHVRAWLAASVGHLLMFAALVPQAEALPVLANEVVRRLGIVPPTGKRRIAQLRPPITPMAGGRMVKYFAKPTKSAALP